jgi:hypothetical protein
VDEAAVTPGEHLAICRRILADVLGQLNGHDIG